MQVNFLGIELLGTEPKFKREKIRRGLLTSSKRRSVREFQFEVVQWRQGNVQKLRPPRAELSLFCLLKLSLFEVHVAVFVVFAKAP